MRNLNQQHQWYEPSDCSAQINLAGPKREPARRSIRHRFSSSAPDGNDTASCACVYQMRAGFRPTMTVLQGYKTIILDDGLCPISFPQDKQMKLIPVLTLYMQDIYKGGLAAEPVE